MPVHEQQRNEAPKSAGTRREEVDKSEIEEIVKMKDGKHPNPNTIHPIAGYDVVG